MAIEFNVDQALQKLGELVEKHGPQAVELAANVVRVNALSDLVGGTIIAGCAVALAGASRWCFLRNEKVGSMGEWQIGTVTFGAGSLVISVWAALALFDPWLWVGLFDPKLKLAHDVLARLTGIS